MKKQLSALFTEGQVKKIRNGVKRQRWSKEDIAQSVALYSSGNKTISTIQIHTFSGLMSKWKQPIFYDFNCKMTVELLHKIIERCKNNGYNIVAIVSDLGGRNRALYSDLQIKMEKPWFNFNGQNIYVFADAPHLIKLLRNHFLDTGFIINNKHVTKSTIYKLLSVTSSDLSITHKISERYLTVCNADRQKVKFATKLFSHTVAKAITRAATLGKLENENWEESYQLFKLTNDWFDLFNVTVPTDGGRERMHALDTQNKILEDMSSLVLNMRKPGKKCQLPFQKDCADTFLVVMRE